MERRDACPGVRAVCVTSVWDRWPSNSSPRGRRELTRIACADGAAQMIIELHPLFEQPWIHALIKPNIRAAQQYGECPHWPIETDGSLPGTCSSYIVAGGQRSETGPPAPIGEFSVHEMHS